MEGEGRYWISTNQHSYSGDRLPRPLWMDSWRQWCWWEMRVFFKCSKHGHRHVYNRPKGNPIPLSLLTTNIPIHSEIKRIGGSKILTLEKPQFQSRRHWIFDPSLSKKKPKCLWYMTISNFLKFRSMVLWDCARTSQIWNVPTETVGRSEPWNWWDTQRMAQHLQDLYSSPLVTRGYERNSGLQVQLGNDNSLGLLKPEEDQGFIL